jgi:hypothetical protein
VNFPFVYSSIPTVPAYGLYIFQLIRYSRACGSYHEFRDRGLPLTRYWTKGSSWLSWCHHFESFTVATMTWLTVMKYPCHKWYGYVPLVITSFVFPHSWLITVFVTTVSLVEQELLTFPEHPSSPPVRVARSLAFCVLFCRSLFVRLSSSVVNRGVCPFYRLWLPL